MDETQPVASDARDRLLDLCTASYEKGLYDGVSAVRDALISIRLRVKADGISWTNLDNIISALAVEIGGDAKVLADK